MNMIFLIFAAFLSIDPLQSTSTIDSNIIIKNEFIYDHAPFVECHASSIESIPDGLVATWFGGSKEGNDDVEIWLSHYRDNKWSAPISVANGIQYEGKRYPCWNPVLFQVPNGPLMLFYKVGPSPSAWWGMLKTSTDGGKTWSEASRLPEGVLGPIKNKPFLASDGRLICPSSTEVNPNEGWRIHFEVSPDFGKTWALTPSLPDPNNFNAIQPSILKHAGEGVLQTIARSKDGGVVSSWSYDNGRTWDEIKPVGLPNPNSGTDAVTLSNGLHLLVYNHSDKPIDKWSGQRSPLNVGISVDGINWQNILELETEKGEFSYPAVIQDQNGLVHITYTWKRRRIKHVVISPEAILNKYSSKRIELEQARKTVQNKLIPVIFDTDVGNDIDDVLALAMLYNYHTQKKIDLLGITINKANDYTVPFIDIFNHYYNLKNTPIGYVGKPGPTPDDGNYLVPVIESKKGTGKHQYKRSRDVSSTNVEEAWRLQRKLIAEQKDHSVVLISVGFSTNLAKLIASPPDQYSSLTGYDLIRKKVKLLSVMAGNFSDSTKAEYNVIKDIPSAKYVFDHWPTEVLIGGWEIGYKVKYPASSIINDFKEGIKNPLVLAYQKFLEMPYDRECWDLISAMVAIEGSDGLFETSAFGKVKVKSDGTVSFAKEINGYQRYLTVKSEELMVIKERLIQSVTGRF